MKTASKLVSVLLAAVMIAACFAVGGCEQTACMVKNDTPAVPVVSYSNVPEDYWNLFYDGSFDENNVWSTDDDRYSEMIAELRSLCTEKAYGSVMVATDDNVLFAGGFGATEIDGVTTVNPFTTYEIGSVTKQFTAAAILQQVQAGKLSVDDTLDKFFPEYPHGAKVTVDNLLHMDSGIQEFLDSMVFFKSAPIAEREAFTAGELPDETILKYLYKNRLNFKPGSVFAYSNTNYWLLALILEQVTGQTYEEYISKNIFDVCDMLYSTCCEYGNITSVPATGYDYLSHRRCCRGAGDMHSNVCDILRWDRTLFGGKIINEEQFEYMTTLRKGYSCGWMAEGENGISHSGSTNSYVMFNTVYTAENIGRVYVIQMCPSQDRVYDFMMDVQKIVAEYIF